MQVVRAGPDVDEDQRPEVHDGQPVGIDRLLRPLGDEVVHDGQEAGGEEKAHRVVAVPPLGQGVLNPREQRVALGPQEADRQGQVVDDVQQGHRHDEGQVEPIRYVDVGLLALPDCAEEDEEVGDPDDGQPEVHEPFRFRVLPACGDAGQVAHGRHDDEELVAPEDEPARQPSGKARPAGPLDDIEGSGDQGVAAEGEDDARGMERAQPTEVQPAMVGEIEDPRPGQLQGDDHAHQHADDGPEDGGDGAGPDDPVLIPPGIGLVAPVGHADSQGGRRGQRRRSEDPAFKPEQGIGRKRRRHQRQEGGRRREDQQGRRTGRRVLLGSGVCHDRQVPSGRSGGHAAAEDRQP